MELQYVPFSVDQYKEYSSWFENKILDNYLGPIGCDWLEAILAWKPEEGMTLAVIDERELVAVVDLCFDPPVPGSCVVAGLAVKPKLRRKGYGAEVVNRLKGKHSQIVVHIDVTNNTALVFFEKLGFVRTSEGAPGAHMYTFLYTS